MARPSLESGMIVYLNGEWLDEGDATVPITDRGFLFADGVFETALLHHGGYFHLEHHLDRLAASAAFMGIVLPPQRDIAAVVHEIAARNSLEDGSLRITVSAGGRDGSIGTMLVTIAPRDVAWIEKAARGWHLITATTRRPSTAAIPAQLKALGRTYALLARREAKAAHADDALLLTDEGTVCEGPSWNVFWRTGNEFFTPALDIGVLAGITRGILMRHAAELGYSVREGKFPRADLDHADEVMASMTSVGIARIRSLDGRALPADTPAADALFARYWAEVTRVCTGRE
jgi:branched-chain amino acid aminotransferase